MNVVRKHVLTGLDVSRDIDITQEQLDNIWVDRKSVQRIVPHLSEDDREFLISGLTAEEWAVIHRNEVM